MYRLIIKRVFDFGVSIFALLFLIPLFICISIFLFFANKNSGVFFLQQRPGKNEKVFKLIKFKTMTDEKDKHGNLLPDVQRLTKIGKFIRSTSLDEIPQLINVMKGDMSLIGPRPLLVKYLPLYSDYQRRRHEVRPGITGWAQVNGRNSISWQRKFELDVWYVDNISFKTDIKILLLTIKNVILRKNINSSSTVIMEAFKGN